MPTLQPGEQFPDLTLPDQHGEPVRLSHLTRPGMLDERLGFADGYPLIVMFYRGFFCPRDQQQLCELVTFQAELAVNYGKLVTIGVDPPLIQAAFCAGLGALWPFLADEDRAVVRQLDILDETEGEYAFRAQPYTFILQANLRIHKIYNGWWFVGRPTLEELRQDLRAIMQQRADYAYATYADEAVQQIRIPQQVWAQGAPPLGANGLPVVQGVVARFSMAAGVGTISSDDLPGEIFFHFTAIPGAGYRTIAPGTPVRCEVVTSATGLSARNIQRLAE